MHEYSLMADLLRKIQRIASDASAERVTAVKVRIGALAHITAEHFREHFETAIAGTVAAGAELSVIQMTDERDPRAQDIVLESIDIVQTEEAQRKDVGIPFRGVHEH